MKNKFQPKTEFQLEGKELKEALAIIKRQERLESFANGLGEGIIRGFISVRYTALKNKLWESIRRNHPELKGQFKIESNSDSVRIKEM